MADYTNNYNLIKPDQTDQYNIDDFNTNADIIDAELKKILDKVSLSLLRINTLGVDKQDKLTGDVGKLIGIGDDGAATTTVYPSNPNLIDNCYFVNPINQRGQTEYTNINGYCIDRWKSGANVYVSLQNNGLSMQNTDQNNERVFYQPIEFAPFLGKTVTFSMIDMENKLYSQTISIPETLSSPGTIGDAVSVGGGRIDIYASSTDVSNGVFNFRFVISKGGIIEPSAVKFEFGPVQTLAHKEGDTWVLNDPPPNPALELVKCQRYYQIFATQSLRPANAQDFRPTMRENPRFGTIVINDINYYTADANL